MKKKNKVINPSHHPKINTKENNKKLFNNPKLKESKMKYLVKMYLIQKNL